MTCRETHHFCCHAIVLTGDQSRSMLAVIVASPGLLDLVANSVDEMRLANLFCWAADFASGRDCCRFSDLLSMTPLSLPQTESG